MSPFSLVEGYLRFGGTFYFRPVPRSEGPSETLVIFLHTTRRHVPEGSHLHIHSRKILTSQVTNIVSYWNEATFTRWYADIFLTVES
jgi:hypothetical protein